MMGSRATPNLRWLGALVLLGALATACGAPTQSATETPIAEPAAGPPGTEAPPPAPNRPLCSDPDAYDRLLQLGPEPQELTLRGGETHAFPVHLDQGQYLEINADQQGIDVYLALFGPDGERLMTTDRPTSRHGAERLPWIASTSGVHRVLACAWGRPDIRGQYLLTSAIADSPSPQQSARTVAALRVHEAQKLHRLDSAKHAPEIESLLRKALDDIHGLETVDLEAEILYRLVVNLQDNGNQLAASSTIQALIPLLRGPENKRLLTSIKRRLASALTKMYRFDEAAVITGEALEIAREIKNDRLIGLLLFDTAEYYNYRGQYLESISYFNKALEAFKKADDEFQTARALEFRAQVFKDVGQRQQAIDDLDAALEIQVRLGNRSNQADLLSTKGITLRDFQRFSEAKRVLNQALTIYSELGDDYNRGLALTSLASVFIDAEDNEEALETCYQALELLSDSWNKYAKAILLHNIGWTLKALTRYSEAIPYLDDSLTLFNDLEDFRRASVTLLALAQTYRKMGELDLALDYGAKAVQYIELSRNRVRGSRLRASLLTTRQAQYDEYIQILINLFEATQDQQYLKLAFATSEQSRARSQLDEILTRQENGTGKASETQLLERERIQNSIGDLERHRLALLESGEPAVEIELVERRLRGLIQDYGLLDAQIQDANGLGLQEDPITSIQEIQSQLDDESALLEYHLGRERSFVWIVRQNRLSVYPLAGQKKIEQQARRTHNLLSRSYQRRWAHQTKRALVSLSDLLLEPIEEDLPRRILVSSDGALDYIPFGALPIDSREQPNEATDRGQVYSFETVSQAHEVVRIPSASILLALRSLRAKRQRARPSLLIVADPVFSTNDERFGGRFVPTREKGPELASNGFDRLFYSRMEAEAVLAAVPGPSTQTLFDFSATSEQVLATGIEDYRFLHFATHGVLDSEYPELSRLVLSQFDRNGNPIHGFLFTHQIDKLNLNADLVVLSACETALGTEVKGEGLVGLPQAFMIAGASSVVVSSWAIDDETTAQLMALFYAGLIEEGLSIPSALQKAQEEIRKREPEPFYWAGFSFLGDWMIRPEFQN